MKIDTAGNQIIEPIQNCDCGLTGGCQKCNPNNFPPVRQYKKSLPDRLTNPNYGKEILDEQLSEQAKNAPSIEEIHKITDKIPKKIWDEATGKIKLCKNCGEILGDFCSRYCKDGFRSFKPNPFSKLAEPKL